MYTRVCRGLLVFTTAINTAAVKTRTAAKVLREEDLILGREIGNWRRVVGCGQMREVIKGKCQHVT